MTSLDETMRTKFYVLLAAVERTICHCVALMHPFRSINEIAANIDSRSPFTLSLFRYSVCV
jgi:hypothetical protein